MTSVISRGTSVILLTLFATCWLISQEQTKAIDLSAINAGSGWKVVNRTATLLEEEGKKVVRFSESAGFGIAWLEDVQFSNGVIEFDARGKDEFQKSFIGVAFHIASADTFDAVYFRPFNFKTPDKVRANHAVQYISHPDYTWNKLRAEKPEQYEKPVSPVPDPNGWFHVRIVIDSPRVSVFVAGSKTPSLVVDQLSTRGQGMVGLFMGSPSGGDFANLEVTPAVAR
jgi:hypothetical protein